MDSRSSDNRARSKASTWHGLPSASASGRSRRSCSAVKQVRPHRGRTLPARPLFARQVLTSMATTEEIDLVIIGGGPAGMAAAIEARRAGVASVAILDDNATLGGQIYRRYGAGFTVL